LLPPIRKATSNITALPPQNLYRFSSIFLSSVHSVEDASAVEDLSRKSALFMRVGTRIAHKTHAFHRLFYEICGNRGKQGCVALTQGTFSKCPEMHRRVLEIWPLIETEHGKQDRLPFHFSNDNYGYYWFFIT
jgi:hypothetical protein